MGVPVRELSLSRGGQECSENEDSDIRVSTFVSLAHRTATDSVTPLERSDIELGHLALTAESNR